jgi:benzoyl-CoA-dihydrodiol lyase
VRGRKAVEWRLVDEVVAKSKWEEGVTARAKALAAKSDRPANGATGITLAPLERLIDGDAILYPNLRVGIDRARSLATVTVLGPEQPPPATLETAHGQGCRFWPLAMARELEDAILHLRFNEPAIGLLLLRAEGDAQTVIAYDDFLDAHAGDWLMREINLYVKRVLKRLDVTAKSLIAVIDPGTCFAGTLAELAFAADRQVMLLGTREGDNRPPAALVLGRANFGRYPMGNGLTRLATRFLGEPEAVARAQEKIGAPLAAAEAEAAGLVTAAIENFDWDDELRVMIEERTSFSPDALTAMEANLRFAGPETLETKIFGRLSAWQNWVFQRPNSVGPQGALKVYGSGVKPTFDRERI